MDNVSVILSVYEYFSSNNGYNNQSNLGLSSSHSRDSPTSSSLGTIEHRQVWPCPSHDIRDGQIRSKGLSDSSIEF